MSWEEQRDTHRTGADDSTSSVEEQLTNISGTLLETWKANWPLAPLPDEDSSETFHHEILERDGVIPAVREKYENYPYIMCPGRKVALVDK